MLSFLTEDLRLTSDISKSSTCFSDLVILLSNPKSALKFKERSAPQSGRQIYVNTASWARCVTQVHRARGEFVYIWSYEDWRCARRQSAAGPTGAPHPCSMCGTESALPGGRWWKRAKCAASQTTNTAKRALRWSTRWWGRLRRALGREGSALGPVDRDTTYLFFSHTYKLQPYNAKLLRTVVDKRIRLIDYELIKRTEGKRVIGFGRWAGIVGAYNGLRAWGIRHGRFPCPAAIDCEDMKDMLSHAKAVDLPCDMKIALTGGGRVGMGAHELLTLPRVERSADATRF